MRVGLCQKIEHVIAREAIKGLLADDLKVSVSDGERTMPKHSTDAAAIEVAMFTTDEDQLHVEYQHVAERGWMLFIYGNNGHNVITDHTTNLELSLKGTSELANKIADEDLTTLARVLAEVKTQRLQPEQLKRRRVVATIAIRRLDKPT